MSQLGTQRDFWNSRAERNWIHREPLIPNADELDFMRRQLSPGGSVLVLGATIQLCETSLAVTDKVISVDSAEKVIDRLRIPGVDYVCNDWFDYFEKTKQKSDVIITDGGLLSIDFPHGWQRLAWHVRSHLKPGGVFASRTYVTTGQPPKDHYNNPDLNRFVSSMGKVDQNWMVHPDNRDYDAYDFYFTFPPEAVVRETFESEGLTLRERFAPDYEEGERFISFAWQKD